MVDWILKIADDGLNILTNTWLKFLALPLEILVVIVAIPLFIFSFLIGLGYYFYIKILKCLTH